MLRIIAAVLVVVFHAHQDAEGKNWTRIFRSEDHVFSIGEAGVHVFFVISGFVMMVASISDKFDICSFLFRRFVRIYPLYWGVLAFALAIFAVIGRHIPTDPFQFVGVLLLWPGLAPRYISPAWTLTFEVYFYLCFAIAMMLGRNRGILALTAFFLGMIALRPFVDTNNPILDVVTNALLIEFLIGAGIGLLAINRRLPVPAGRWLMAASVLLFVAGLGLGDNDLMPKVVLWGVPSAFLILGAVCWESQSKMPRLVTTLARYGDGSYMLYLLHKPLQWGLLAAFVAIWPASTITAIIWVLPISLVCIIISELAYRRMEKPMMMFLRSRRSPKQMLPT